MKRFIFIALFLSLTSAANSITIEGTRHDITKLVSYFKEAEPKMLIVDQNLSKAGYTYTFEMGQEQGAVYQMIMTSCDPDKIQQCASITLKTCFVNIHEKDDGLAKNLVQQFNESVRFGKMVMPTQLPHAVCIVYDMAAVHLKDEDQFKELRGRWLTSLQVASAMVAQLRQKQESQ